MKLRMKVKVVLFIAVTLSGALVWAYIPPFWMILSRTAGNHGWGTYQVEQDVIFSHGSQPQVVREIWTIENEEKMRLKVIGRKSLDKKIDLNFVYRDYKRHQVNESGEVKSAPVTSDWFEPYFHFRSSEKIKPVLFTQKMIPQEALKKPKTPWNLKQAEQMTQPEDFTRLTRVNGVVSYGISPTYPSTSGLWIEQDQFHIQRLRLLSQAQILAQTYKRFARGLWLPSTRVINWEDHSVEIRLVRVIPLRRSKTVIQKLNPQKMNPQKDKQVWLKDDFIKNFYLRFR